MNAELHEYRISQVERNVENLDDRVNKLEHLATKITVAAFLGSAVGGALLSWLVKNL